MNLEALLAEVAPQNPCGPDLTYDSEFLELEQAARGRPEQQFGETRIHAEEPDWGKVRECALALWSRTRDLRVAVFLTRALTQLDDFSGLASGLTLLKGLLERYWDQVHPRLDAEDDDDPTMRLNALAPLADPDTVLRQVRELYLVPPGRHGAVAVRGLLVALGKWPAGSGGPAPSRAELEGVLRAAAADGALPLEALRASVQALDGLRRVLTERVGLERVPRLRPLSDLLASLLQVCDAALGEEEQTDDQESGAGVTGTSDDGALAGSLKEIRSREDAVRMLQRVVDFIERTEPANPAPLFIRRAQRLMTKNFVEIIQDLVPDSLGQIQKMAGLENE